MAVPVLSCLESRRPRFNLFPYTTLFRSLQTHNVNRCGRSRHLARKLSLRRKRSRAFSPNDDRSEERFSRNAETELVCRVLLVKKNGHGLGLGQEGAHGEERARRAYSRFR